MINYRVRDLDAMLAQLRAAGAEVDESVEEFEYGRFGWAVDPEGNRFELGEPRRIDALPGMVEEHLRGSHEDLGLRPRAPLHLHRLLEDRDQDRRIKVHRVDWERGDLLPGLVELLLLPRRRLVQPGEDPPH